MDFQQQLATKITKIEQLLSAYLPPEQGRARTVLQAMNYSVNAGGKRLRPLLLAETYTLFGGSEQVAEPFAAAIEMIHTYSLVHDDLPAMDNDEYRRGKKTTHAVFGEAMGILAGDALLTFAFETAAKGLELTADATRVARAMGLLAKKAGIYGMLGGQVIDVEAEGNQNLTLDQILEIHTLKTGALLEASMMIGAVLAGADEEDMGKLERIARNIGIAFQIQDDILDLTGTMEELGKPIGSDKRNEKVTYVTLEGIEKSAKEVKRLSDEAVMLLHSLQKDSEFLEQLILSLVNRRK
ncbi:MAG: polyprenyl synthetase family protein [Lachnospiraceae bacterium]|nr:polyprenyl synthetase family protein [Lachnospiraceae bacterium]